MLCSAGDHFHFMVVYPLECIDPGPNYACLGVPSNPRPSLAERAMEATPDLFFISKGSARFGVYRNLLCLSNTSLCCTLVSKLAIACLVFGQSAVRTPPGSTLFFLEEGFRSQPSIFRRKRKASPTVKADSCMKPTQEKCIPAVLQC